MVKDSEKKQQWNCCLKGPKCGQKIFGVHVNTKRAGFQKASYNGDPGEVVMIDHDKILGCDHESKWLKLGAGKIIGGE